MNKRDRLLFAGGALFITGYVMLLALPALKGYFSRDDLTNLYRAWSLPQGRLALDNLLFFRHSPYYRPLAEAWYRVIFAVCGFRPWPFKAVNLLILLVNLFLTYSVGYRLSQSRAVASLTTLLISFHGNFILLYADTAFVFDTLCYCFYFAALAWYVSIRRQGRYLHWREIAGVSVLYICALNSKEIAVSLPVFLLAYEVSMERRSPGRLTPRRWWPVLTAGAITVLFIAGRILTPADSLFSMAAYRPVFTWNRFMETSRGFTGALFYSDHWFTPARVLTLWAALLAVVLIRRSVTLARAWLFLMITPLPVAFILPRGCPQYYIPFFGWTLFAAAAVIDIVNLLVRILPAANREVSLRAAVAALMVAIACALYPHERAAWVYGAPSITIEGAATRSVIEQLRRTCPRLHHGSRLLFLEDPFQSEWDLLFLVRLSYRDESLTVDTTRLLQKIRAEQPTASYDHVFDYRGGHLIELSPPWRRQRTPAVVIESGRPKVYHAGFVPVTPEHPAETSEFLISQVFDLGTDNSRVFPADPLIRIDSDVAVYVDCQPAEVSTKVGWPGETNRYRVDFRIPPTTQRGMAKVMLKLDQAGGVPVEIPVR